ncbi:uncharacterized protein LOC143185888 isoform X2 [Calliopsis andreniformis]|uniref:uncharacterized protein LOC143185888 isoform X2 n=1 Tax=Calliopsis andreniformis TaxID=337506 RepID=UPI003FCE45FF
MAEDCTDADYLGAYSRFFAEFVAKVNPYDQLPVSVSSYNVTDAEIVGEIINVTLQYLNQTQCPPSLQAHLVHQVIQEIKSICKKQPEDCGFKFQEKTYTSLKLMQAITGKVNEICTRYLDNSRLALLPPPPSTPLPQVIAGGNKNCKRRMEDRYVVLHDLHTTFGILGGSVANYYAVFDGHAGQDAAVYCATHLHQYLAESIYYPTDPERALRDAFVTTDAQFIEKSKTQKVVGGTTAVCTLLLNKKLYVSWVGDSSAMIVKRDGIVQLVNPHRLHREDEVQRIQRMGGVVMRSMGIMRVNGALSVSRAIGDVRYKPFVSGDPEIRCYTLDGTEDFLVIATDGLTDFMQPAEILTILYHEIYRNPNGLKRAHQILLQWAKHAGSRDNITLVVVLLTPATEIAARSPKAHPLYSSQVDEILEKMNSKEKPLFLAIDDAHNAINSNILKQAIISQEPREHEDDGILAASNGKHENGDADYDYSDLGPETDVDAIDDVATMPVKNLSYDFYKDDESSHDEDHIDRDSNILDNAKSMNDKQQPDAENNLHPDDQDEILNTARDMVREVPQPNFGEMRDDDIREQIEEAVNDVEGETKDEDRVLNVQDIGDDAEPVDYDSPPSPQDNKTLQHALIPEADNVADSEDSEDEWNYYPVDPNQEKDSTTPVDKLQESKSEKEIDSPEPPAEDIESKIQSHDIEEEEESEEEEEVEEAEEEEEEIKCKSPKEELSKLIDTEISAEDRALEPEQEQTLISEDQDKSKDMDFQLNPDAAEFIPVSPQFAGNRMNLIEDYPISGSPLKQVEQMDDIQVPSQSEFEEEICRRPREVETEEKGYSNGDSQRNDETDFTCDQQKGIGLFGNLDDSEISSTKAEFGDESSVSFLTAPESHRTGISTVDESFSSSERDYDIAKDPMAMSFTPSDFEAAFDKGVDLNAVHNLSDTDLDDKNGSMDEEGFTAQSPEPCAELTTELTTELATELASETEQLTHTPAFSSESAELVNLSSQQEDSDETFIEHPDKPKTTIDFLNVQTDPFQLDQQETAKSDNSPLTENYSGECESEKEVISVENEQPLSPSSVDIDETKPLDETSEDAMLPGSDLQKEVSAKEVDTPSSLSPVPDAMENDAVVTTEDTEVPPDSIHSSLHPDAPEFMPGQYNFHSYAMESDDVQQSSVAEKASEVCKSSLMETVDDVCKPFSPMETVNDVCKTSPMETVNDVCKISPIETVNDVCKSPLMETTDDVCQSTHIKTTDDVCQSTHIETADDVCQFSSMKPVDDICKLSPIETKDVCESPAIASDEVCQSPTPEANDVCEAPTIMSEDVCKLNSMKTSDLLEQNLNEGTQLAEEKVVEPMSTQPAQDNLLDFDEQEDQEVCMRSQTEADPTPPPTPQKLEVAEGIEDIACPIKSTIQETSEKIAESIEALAKSEILETKTHEVEESMIEAEMKLSESMQEFTGLESQLQPTLEKTLEETPVVSSMVPELQEEVPKQEELKKEIIEPEKLFEPAIENECKLEKKVEEIITVDKEVPTVEPTSSVVEEAPPKIDVASPEVKEPEVATTTETPGLKLATTAAAVVAATAVGAAASTAHNKQKTKPATKSTKTTASKPGQKSTPTSPSKTVTSTTKVSNTTAKKPSTSVAARPKDLDAPKKTTVSSPTSTKAPATKSASKPTTTTTSAAKPTTRSSVSSTTKPKPTATAPKAAATDKKPTTNGEVKPLSKPAATKPPVSKAPSTTKTSLVKTSTSSTRTSTGTTTLTKPRPTSATTTSKPSTTAKPSSTTTTTTARPKTAPIVGSATKPRTTTAKSPIIDKNYNNHIQTHVRH